MLMMKVFQPKACHVLAYCLLKFSFQMHNLGLVPSTYTYDGIVKAAIAGKQIAYAIKVVCLGFLSVTCDPVT